MTGIISGESNFQKLALSITQLAIDDFTTCNQGFDIGNHTFGIRLALAHLLPEDRYELTTDGSSWICREVLKVTSKTCLEYPFLFKVLSTGDLLIGIDDRDLT